MTVSAPEFKTTPIPGTKPDDTPPLEGDGYAADPDAPYGRFANGNPRKRPPKDTGSTRGRMPASESQAKAAAALLAQVNALTCMGLMGVGFSETASAIAERNDGFEEAAYNALLTDPALCKQILKAGTTSGKVALLLAYGMLLTSVAPVAIVEYRTKRNERLESVDNDGSI